MARHRSLLAGLIRTPSLLGAEAGAQHYLAAAAADAGLDVELWDVDPSTLSADPDYAVADGGEGARPNLTGILPGTGGGRSIAVSGHVDVVPVEPLRMWTHDPWGACVENGRMYGRGALDMKGGLVAGRFAIHAIRDCYGALPGDISSSSRLSRRNALGTAPLLPASTARTLMPRSFLKLAARTCRSRIRECCRCSRSP